MYSISSVIHGYFVFISGQFSTLIKWCQQNCAKAITFIQTPRSYKHEFTYPPHNVIEWGMLKLGQALQFALQNSKDSHISYELSCTASILLAEWRSGSVSALPCGRPGFASRTRLGEIIPANNCTMQGQNNWGNWGSPGVMKLWVAWEVLRWLMKFRELCSGGFHPKLVTPPYHGFLNVNTPPNSQNSKRH